MHNERSLSLKWMIFNEKHRLLVESKFEVDDFAAGGLVFGVFRLRYFICGLFEPVSLIWFQIRFLVLAAGLYLYIREPYFCVRLANEQARQTLRR